MPRCPAAASAADGGAHGGGGGVPCGIGRVLEFAVDDAEKEQYGNRCRHFPLAGQGAACGQPRPLKVVDRDYLIGGGREEHPHLALYARMNTSLLKLALTDPAA